MLCSLTRYELVHFEGMVDKTRLFRAHQEVVDRKKILRTVFVRLDGIPFSVVLDAAFTTPVVEYEIEDDDVEPFARRLSAPEPKTRIPTATFSPSGSSFTHDS
ncbi:hypothetical protein F5144DRAFT_605123 [Chaetomium tenue]|uniref:Uncharacterized protein n=1 Tax=Chaetomium tenue TaxID=1854479 RepID=A0ACB7P0M0_9PEZI|nr:hypothetical protein F5144DRAFT_605123 [Chaetomium globosum]